MDFVTKRLRQSNLKLRSGFYPFGGLCGKVKMIFRGTKIQTLPTINIAKSIVDKCIGKSVKTCHCPSTMGHYFRLRNPTGTTLVFPEASFRAMDGKPFFRFAIWFNGYWVFVLDCSMGLRSLLLRSRRTGYFDRIEGS